MSTELLDAIAKLVGALAALVAAFNGTIALVKRKNRHRRSRQRRETRD